MIKKNKYELKNTVIKGNKINEWIKDYCGKIYN